MLELPVLGSETAPQSAVHTVNGARLVYVETYGCQMNLNDTEIVLGILSANGYGVASRPEEADVILLNTCAVREHAEQRVLERLNHLKPYKRQKPWLVVGILGCMAERLRSRLLGRNALVELVVGPDEYRKLPQLLEHAFAGEQGIAVRLSRVETTTISSRCAPRASARGSRSCAAATNSALSASCPSPEGGSVRAR